MKKKQVLGIFLSAAVALSALTGCGGKAETGKEGSSEKEGLAAVESQAEEKDSAAAGEAKYKRNEEGYPDLQGETFTIWFAMTGANAQNTNDMENYEAIQQLEEKFNCKFSFVHPPVGQEKDNFTIMMADSTLPDMIFCGGIDSYYPGGVEMALEDGVLYDYTDKINAVDTPNFYKIIQNDEFMKKAVTDDEGRIIRLGAKICGSEEADLSYQGLMIRKDYLEQTGMDVPVTIDDWTKMLAAMKANGVEYPLALDKEDKAVTTSVFSAAYGIGSQFYVKEDGKVGYGPYEDAYKDLLTTLNCWYKEGYMNPDFSTQTGDAVMSLAASDRVGSSILHLYTYGTTYYVTTESKDESKALIPAPTPVLKESDTPRMRQSSRQLGDYKYITADAKNPDACIALLDALYLEDINFMLANGIEGKGYEMVDGVPILTRLTADTPSEIYLASCPQQWHTYEDTDLDYILTKKYNLGSQPDALLMWKEEKTDGQLSNFILFNTEESERKGRYQADIDTYVEEMSLKFIMGIEPLDSFEEFRQNLRDLHIEDMIQIRQDAMERYNSR